MDIEERKRILNELIVSIDEQLEAEVQTIPDDKRLELEEKRDEAELELNNLIRPNN